MPRPVNALVGRGVPPVAELSAAGVARVSVGGGFAFAIERDGAYADQWLVVEIRETDIEIEVVEAPLDFLRGHREDGGGRLGIPVGKRRGDERHHGERRRDDTHPQAAGETTAALAHVLSEGLHVGEDALCPGEDALPFGGQAAEALAAFDDEDAEGILEVLDARRQRRLGHVARRGRAGEVFLPREGRQILQVLDQRRSGVGGVFDDWGRHGQAAGARVTTIDLDVGWLLPSATLSSGTSTFVSG